MARKKYAVYYTKFIHGLTLVVPREVDRADYRPVAVVEADDLEGVFRARNHMDGSDIERVGPSERSMCTGDLAVEYEGTNEGVVHHCSFIGWDTVQWKKPQ
jgi:hypothetical protein